MTWVPGVPADTAAISCTMFRARLVCSTLDAFLFEELVHVLAISTSEVSNHSERALMTQRRDETNLWKFDNEPKAHRFGTSIRFAFLI